MTRTLRLVVPVVLAATACQGTPSTTAPTAPSPTSPATSAAAPTTSAPAPSSASASAAASSPGLGDESGGNTESTKWLLENCPVSTSTQKGSSGAAIYSIAIIYSPNHERGWSYDEANDRFVPADYVLPANTRVCTNFESSRKAKRQGSQDYVQAIPVMSMDNPEGLFYVSWGSNSGCVRDVAQTNAACETADKGFRLDRTLSEQARKK